MSSSNVYRINAEDCLRMAAAAQDERDKPFSRGCALPSIPRVATLNPE
jgi:hypothetical protein